MGRQSSAYENSDSSKPHERGLSLETLGSSMFRHVWITDVFDIESDDKSDQCACMQRAFGRTRTDNESRGPKKSKSFEDTGDGMMGGSTW